MALHPLKIFAILIVTTLVAGCKLIVVVVEGGAVESPSSTPFCAEGSNCVIEIADANFNRSFTAVPKDGYEFVRWQAGTGFQCGDSTNTICTVSLPAGDLGALAITLFETIYIMPVWKDVGIDTDNDGEPDRTDSDDDDDGVEDDLDACPLEGPNLNDSGCPYTLITDTVNADGREWAQVDLFSGLSWAEMNAVCPEGTCIDNGVLNGQDMTGWTLASLNDVNSLFSYYLTLTNGFLVGMGPGADVVNDPSGELSVWFFGVDDWRTTDGTYATGFTSDPNLYARIGYNFAAESEQAATNLLVASAAEPNIGGWFYR